MKIIKNIMSISAAMALAAAMTSCSNANSDSEKQFERTAPDSVSFEWQKAYEDKLKEFKESKDYSDDQESGSAFDLFDITGDGSPELIISPNTGGSTKCSVYSFSDGEASEIGSVGNTGCFMYLPLINTVKDEYCGDGFVIGKLFKYENGSFNQELSYSDNSQSVMSSDTSGTLIVHEINGEEVLLPEYDKALEPYEKSPAVKVGRKYSMGDGVIKYAVYRAESWGKIISPADKKLCMDMLKEKLLPEYESGSEITYELADLNNDDVPELLVSAGTYPEAPCSIFYFKNNTLCPVDGTYGSWGEITLDTDNLIFYSVSGTETIYWSIANSAFSSTSYVSSGNTAVLGRKRLLTEENLSADFS